MTPLELDRLRLGSATHPAIAVTDEYARSGAIQDQSCGRQVCLEGGLRFLHNGDGVAIVLKNICDGLPPGAVGERSMNRHHILHGAVSQRYEGQRK